MMLIATVAGGSDRSRFKQRTGSKTGLQCWAFSKSKGKSSFQTLGAGWKCSTICSYAFLRRCWLQLVRWSYGYRYSIMPKSEAHTLPALVIDVIAGAAFASFASLSRTRKLSLVLLLLWLTVSTFSYFPHMIPYMNEWVVDRSLAYKILADSNLDWGRNEQLVHEFLKQNPDVILNPDMPVSGRVLINVNSLVGIWPGKKSLFWALHYRPIAHVGYANLLYDMPVRRQNFWAVFPQLFVFGQETFAQVVASAGKSLKENFDPLENGLRRVTDFRAHRKIGRSESYPSIAQSKPQVELLLQQVEARLKGEK
jgi:hypothetical protein